MGRMGAVCTSQTRPLYERLRPRAHERPALTVQAHATVQYTGAAAAVILAEREGETLGGEALRALVGL